MTPSGEQTFTYVGAEFDNTVQAGFIPITGHLEGSVTFATDMTGFTGTATLADISSYSLKVVGTSYAASYPNPQLCPPGNFDVMFTFVDGTITSWVLETNFITTKTACRPGYGDYGDVSIQTVSNSGGQQDGAEWSNPNGPNAHGGTITRSAHGWQPAS